jgi:hypothetical protein
MDEQQKDKYKIPAEWIDRIFKRFDEIWGSRFLNRFNSDTDFDLERLRWQSGLFGATADEIRRVLDMCRGGYIKDPPHCVEFFHYCKGKILPPTTKPKTTTLSSQNREIAQKYLDLIKAKLHGKLGSEGQAALSALDQQILDKQKPKEQAHWTDN